MTPAEGTTFVVTDVELDAPRATDDTLVRLLRAADARTTESALS